MSEDRYEEDPDFYYVTKYYFTMGIVRLPKEDCTVFQKKLFIGDAHSERSFGRTSWHLSLPAAHDRAAELIGNKIFSLERQISKLKKKDPTEEPVVDFTIVEDPEGSDEDE